MEKVLRSQGKREKRDKCNSMQSKCLPDFSTGVSIVRESERKKGHERNGQRKSGGRNTEGR